MEKATDITAMLVNASNGKKWASDRLWSVVYDELHKMASMQLRYENRKRSFTSTALVHEAYLRIMDSDKIDWQNRAHFFGIASRVMRRVIVDNARKISAQKRGGGQCNDTFDEQAFIAEENVQEVIDLDQALEQLALLNERWSKVVECRYFGGLTTEETAQALDVSPRTVERDWLKAKTWLYSQMAAPAIS